MKISVVIPAYNEEKFLPNLLQSLKKQTFKKPFEIVVCDNNSTDNTAKIAKAYGARVVTEKKRGYAYACNKAFFSAKGDVLARADADHVVPPDWIENIHNAFAEDSTLISTGGPIYPLEGNIIEGLIYYPSALIWMFILKTIGRGFLFPNMAVTRKAFYKVEGFDHNVHFGEDTDLCKRLKKIGKVTLNPKIYAYTSMRRFQSLGFFGFVFKYAFLNEIAKSNPGHKHIKPVGMEPIRSVLDKKAKPRRPLPLLIAGPVTVCVLLACVISTPFFISHEKTSLHHLWHQLSSSQRIRVVNELISN